LIDQLSDCLSDYRLYIQWWVQQWVACC